MVRRRTSDCQIYTCNFPFFYFASYYNVRTTCPPSAVARLSTTDVCVLCTHNRAARKYTVNRLVIPLKYQLDPISCQIDFQTQTFQIQSQRNSQRRHQTPFSEFRDEFQNR